MTTVIPSQRRGVPEFAESEWAEQGTPQTSFFAITVIGPPAVPTVPAFRGAAWCLGLAVLIVLTYPTLAPRRRRRAL